MGTLTSYAIHSSIYLLAGYIIYKWLMAGEKQMKMNRATLLLIYVIAFAALPIAYLSKNSAITSGMPLSANSIQVEPFNFVSADTNEGAVWATMIVYTYILGVIVTTVWSIISYIRINRLIASGKISAYTDNIKLVILPNGKAAPFSWMNYIAMTEDDYSTGGEVIIAHELAHIHHRHCLDLIISQLVCIFQWFNPAAWLMREELKTVHEFQADDTVINSGIEPRQYQMLLIKKAVGTRFQSLANSLNHSNLKKRITMMYTQKSSAGRKMRVLALVPAIALALAVSNIPAVASTIYATSEVKVSPVSARNISANKVSENSIAAQTALTDNQDNVAKPAEVLPQYPGGEFAMMQFLINNLKYPAEAEAAHQEGRVVVKFVVKADGSIGETEVIQSVSPSLDAEAVRVIKAMPNWTPGKSNGQAVDCTYTLPIKFKLPPAKKETK